MANLATCSNGERVAETTIRRRYTQALKVKHAGKTAFVCEGCGARSEHNDHTISQKRCKHLHKTELIWHPGNFVNSCNKCHKEWESFKSGNWIKHANVTERLQFLKEHDPDGFRERIELTTLSLQQAA